MLATRPARDAALHPLRRLHEPLRRLPPDRRPRLRLDLSGPDGRGAHPGARRPRQVARPAARLHHERPLPGGLPGRHPAADPAARLARPELARGAGAGLGARRPRPVGLPRPATRASTGSRPRRACASMRMFTPRRLDQLAAAGRGWTGERDFPAPPGRTFMERVQGGGSAGDGDARATSWLPSRRRWAASGATRLPSRPRPRPCWQPRADPPAPARHGAWSTCSPSASRTRAGRDRGAGREPGRAAGGRAALPEAPRPAASRRPPARARAPAARLVGHRAARHDGAGRAGRASASRDWGIAETGTLVFHSGPDTPILLNFLPLHHIVALRAGQHPAAPRGLRGPSGRRSRRRATLVLITGASGTTDIEGSYVRGAHGPGYLHVVIVGDGEA